VKEVFKKLTPDWFDDDEKEVFKKLNPDWFDDDED
jgi:hypothetical protein